MEKRLVKIAMNSRYGISKYIGRGLVNNYRKIHGLPLFRKKNKKKRRYSRYPGCELYKTMMQLKPLRRCEICGKPYAIIRQDIYFRPCLCDTCYIGVKGDIDDRDAMEEIFKEN